ncbi:MAG: hypothetical protein QM759_09620 [Terricaulis sp.]
MKHYALLAAALMSIAACQPAATTTATTSAAATAAPSFNVQALAENDIQIQGCTRSLSRTGATDTIFAEDGVDTGAKGIIRIDGQLINVSLTAGTGDEQHSNRNFADAAHTLAIVENLTTGAAHEESDSVEESGTLAVTYKGTTQTIQVEGGVAC